MSQTNVDEAVAKCQITKNYITILNEIDKCPKLARRI
jgi:hypothetical protein